MAKEMHRRKTKERKKPMKFQNKLEENKKRKIKQLTTLTIVLAWMLSICMMRVYNLYIMASGSH